MKILLIDPPWIVKNERNLWRMVRSCLPSLGLASVAGSLEAAGHQVSVLDCTAEQIAVDAFKSRLLSLGPPDFVGLTATTPLFPNALSIARIAKSVYPGCKVLFGGVHATVCTRETLSHEFVDYVVRDEGELTAVELVNGAAPSTVLGLSYREGAKIIDNPQRPLVRDLDSLPLPAYHLLPMKRYRPAVGAYQRLPAMSIFATRGCPGRCTFCYRTFRGKVRRRPARSIVKEIRLLQRNYGVREICFYDDTFTAFRDVVLDFCRIATEERLELTWSCFTRVDYIDREMLLAMKRSGCHLILFGVESADEGILHTINKRISLEETKQAVRLAREAGIQTRASFMLGNPGETEDTMEETIRFACELDPDQVQFNITTVYPGTEMYEWARKNNYIIENDWSKYNVSDIVLELPTVSAETVKKYYQSAHRRFYLRPRVILRRLLNIRSPAQLLQEVRGAMAVIRA